MLIDERARQCVAYLVEESIQDGVQTRWPVGTLFFVGEEIDERGALRYAVTAAHVILDVQPGTQQYVRVNLCTGGVFDVPIVVADWVIHPSSDVAVCDFTTVLSRCTTEWTAFDQRSIGADWYWVGCGSGVALEEVGVGDEVALVGLLAEHPGTLRNQPIVRFGHVSLAPHEPIPLELAPNQPRSVDAFVVEAQSWGGQSGSPVFMYWPHFREWQEQDKGARGPWLLGLVHGSFKTDEPIRKPVGIPGDWGFGANAGLTVVIPATTILETFGLLRERA
jgi:hypothetical protein